jgi:hypothetical protein
MQVTGAGEKMVGAPHPCPIDPAKHPQKLFIKGGHSLQSERIFLQSMTVFCSFNPSRLKRRLKASIHLFHTHSNKLYNIRNFGAFAANSNQLKKPSVGPKGLIGPPCHGVKFYFHKNP